MKRILLEEIQKRKNIKTYRILCSYIVAAIENGELKPLMASGTNGKKPALYKEYWMVEEQRDYSKLIEEIRYQLLPLISNDYYFKHLPQYEKDRESVLQLNVYLKHHRDLLANFVSVNERSFEIWGREKFLSREGGLTLLKRCGIAPSFLNYYETTEPLPYYSHTRQIPQSVLMLENKDTFYSMRRYLLSGRDSILGENVGTLLFGAGKGIYRSFRDFSLCVEPYLNHKENTLLYFGDIDFEGIRIYEKLALLFEAEHEIIPFVSGYETMITKAAAKSVWTTPDNQCSEESIYEYLPKMKDKQVREIGEHFFSYFSEEKKTQMRKILESNRYIPQEILNCCDF